MRIVRTKVASCVVLMVGCLALPNAHKNNWSEQLINMGNTATPAGGQ